MTKISIIVPVYNVKEYLSECVASIRNQTLSEIEIILVDDGSADGSAELCDAFAKRDGRIKVIHQENGGSTKARNAGLLASCGSYVGFVDSDDWVEPNMYEELLKQCIQNHADIAVCAKYRNHKKSGYIEPVGIPDGIYERGDKTLTRNLIYSEKDMSRGISPNLYDKLFKRELLCKHQLAVNDRIKYGEDDVCVYACLLDAERVVFVEQAYYHYRQREGSVCHTADTMYFERITWFYQQLKETFTAHPDADILMDQLDHYMLEFILRGINKQFGFGYGVVIPYYLPPYERLNSEKMQKIVLYGAGNVGQDYFRALQMWNTAEVVLWADRQFEDYKKKGLPVESVSSIGSICCDGVLIAVDNPKLAGQIREDLVNMGIEENKILYEKPRTMIQDVRRMG